MKSSLSKVFDGINKGQNPEDRIFGKPSSYNIDFNDINLAFDENTDDFSKQSDAFYVINSFNGVFEFTNECMSTLLVDAETRKEYDDLLSDLSDDIKEIESDLSKLSGLSKKDVKGFLSKDFGLSNEEEWTDIFQHLEATLDSINSNVDLSSIIYKVIFNEKTVVLFSDSQFLKNIANYTSRIIALYDASEVLTRKFNDRNAEAFGKSLKENDIFSANHVIKLKNGQEIASLKQWNDLVKKEFDKILVDDSLKDSFNKIKKVLNANNDTSAFKQLIVERPEIIPCLNDLDNLKRCLWKVYLGSMSRPFTDYCSKFKKVETKLKEVYAKANEQSQEWKDVIKVFSDRFLVPFEIQIVNKANFCLKDEAPHVSFVYKKGLDTATLSKNDLMSVISVGEQRALYILYILFDIERIKRSAQNEKKNYLIITDDISDSFDYKNKYAIIEYLKDLTEFETIGLLVLTHNFDFYRNAGSRLGIKRENRLIAFGVDGDITIEVFKYQKDYFRNFLIEQLKNTSVDAETKIKLLISSVPFFRNISDYRTDQDSYIKFTCLLHIKTTPVNTKTIKIDDIAQWIDSQMSEQLIGNISRELYVDKIFRIADSLISSNDEVALENKFILAMASRLLCEEFLAARANKNSVYLTEEEGNQTATWIDKVSPYLSKEEKSLLSELSIATPENIHVNSFMYEPLVDVSIWMLKGIYSSIKDLKEKETK